MCVCVSVGVCVGVCVCGWGCVCRCVGVCRCRLSARVRECDMFVGRCMFVCVCVCARANMDRVKDWRGTCTCIAIYGFAPTGSVSHSFYEHIRQRMSRNQCGLRVMHSLPLGDINRPRDQLPFSMEEVTVASAVVVCRSPTGDRLLND